MDLPGGGQAKGLVEGAVGEETSAAERAQDGGIGPAAPRKDWEVGCNSRLLFSVSVRAELSALRW